MMDRVPGAWKPRGPGGNAESATFWPCRGTPVGRKRGEREGNEKGGRMGGRRERKRNEEGVRIGSRREKEGDGREEKGEGEE